MRATGRHMMKSTSMSSEIYGMEHPDGSQSDTALGSLGSGIKKRRSSLSQRVVAILPSRRSRSTSQLSQTGQTLTGTSRCFYLLCLHLIMFHYHAFVAIMQDEHSSFFKIRGIVVCFSNKIRLNAKKLLQKGLR